LPNTFSSLELIASLRRQPLLAVLRCPDQSQMLASIDQIHSIGIRHVELVWREDPGWIDLCLRIQSHYPSLLIGGASVCGRRALDDCAAAGFGYAMAPILDSDLVRQAEQLGITLVPGVMTPTEVVRARQLGCGLVKLFPAATLGIGYWRQLAGPLGALPFCIAAGGLHPSAVPDWLGAGVDAVALGGAMFDRTEGPVLLDPAMSGLVQWLDGQLS
jgi:2-dehydro-3-deoxyphosphogluconate aldolase / (4S)-4-hydroxy-2-oxoglutarate aldolase